jgi:hypothetical protein
MRQAARLAFILPALFALAIQILAIQPHVHLARLSLAAALPAGDVVNASMPKGKPSPGGDTANCPLCQTPARGGDAVLPTIIAISAPDAEPPAVLFDAAPQRISAASHDWRGRAPPLA